MAALVIPGVADAHLTPGAARVLIEGSSASGREYRAVRTYEPCIPGRGKRRLRSTNLAGRR